MEINNWRKGINISIENAIELFNNGKLLIEKGSYGHGLFLVITASEELSIAYFIMESYNTPRPDQLQTNGFLNHQKKLALTSFKSGQLTNIDNIPLQEKLLKKHQDIIQKEIDKKASAFYEKVYRNLGKEIIDEYNLWELRNRGIYVDLNLNKTTFICPQDITKEQALKVVSFVDKQIFYAQMQRDILFKYGTVNPKILKAVKRDYEETEKVFRLVKILTNGPISELESYNSITSEDKEFLKKTITNNKQVDLNDIEIISNIIQIIVSPILNKKRKKLSKSEIEKLKYYHERLKHYNPEQAKLYELSTNLLNSIKEGSFNTENYRKFASLYFNSNTERSS